MAQASDDTQVRRGPSPRRTWRKALVPILLAVSIVVAGSTYLFLHSSGEARSIPHASVIHEVKTLLGANGLYTRPGLGSDGADSWSASAYALPALAGITSKVEIRNPSALKRSLTVEIRRDPLWGPWYGARVEAATGREIPGDWASGVLHIHHFSSAPQNAIAEIAAVADVVNEKSLGISANLRSRYSQILTRSVAQTANPYSRCRAVDAARIFGVNWQKWHFSSPSTLRLGKIFDTNSIMNVYGQLCLLKYGRVSVPVPLRKKAAAWLRAQLGASVAGSELEVFYLVSSWLLIKEPPSDLSALKESIERRVDKNSGLVRSYVIRLGTLANTYYAALLFDAAGVAKYELRARTLAAVKKIADNVKTKGDAVDMLMCAVILHLGGKSDRKLENDSTKIAAKWLDGKIKKADIPTASRIVTLLNQLGRRVPRFSIAKFTVSSDEDRYDAWLALGMGPYVDKQTAIRALYARQLSEARDTLRAPRVSMTKEIVASAHVGVSWNRDDPSKNLRSWMNSIHGCDGFPALYKPAPAVSRCTLEATYGILTVGLME